jgi:NTE family protein
VYDNLGIEPFRHLEKSVCAVVLNAGGTFRVGKFGGLPIVRNLSRASAVMYRQTTVVRMQELLSDFKAWEAAVKAGRQAPPKARLGVMFALGTTFETLATAWAQGRPPDPDPTHLQNLPTSFLRFGVEDARRLIDRGWWLTGASLATYHPELIRELPDIVPMS